MNNENHLPKIRSGFLEGALFLKSSHFNTRPKGEISLLVIHNISLPPKVFGGNFVEKFFLGEKLTGHPFFKEINGVEVSSHLYIKRTGKIVQFVSFLDRAWHAGKSSFKGRENCNDFSIGIELEGTDDLPFTKEQYDSLIRVTKSLMNTYPQITKERITGHSNIAPLRKTDPGECFDWAGFLSRLD